MTTPIKIKRSGTASSTPSSLDHGELAINYADDTLFWKDSANVIQSFVFQAYASATHKSTHATGGSDALTPADIGAAPAASPAITGNATFEASSGVPVTITNTGSGNSFVVNDAAGDTTPFVVDADGNVGVGTSPASFNSAFNNVVIGNGSSVEGMTIYSSAQGTLAFGDTATTGADGYQGYLAYIHSGDYMVMATGGAERLRVSAVGVGFGVGDLSRFSSSFRDIVVGSGVGNHGITINSGQADVSTLAFASNVAQFRGAVQYFNETWAGGEYMRFLVGTLSRLAILANGRVGVGTEQPSSLLHVAGVITVSATSGSAGSYAPSVTFSGDANTGFGQVSGESDTASIFTASHERVRVRADGNVGIGYAGASNHRVSVAGNHGATGFNLGFYVGGTAQPAATVLYPFFSQPSVAAGCTLTELVHFFALSGTHTGTVTTEIGFAVSNLATTSTNARAFQGNIAAGTNRHNLFMGGSAQNYLAGNVGIGSGRTAPATALDVNGVITVSATSGSAGSYAPSVTFSGDANTGFGQVLGESDSASIFTASHERVRVRADGGVAIGYAGSAFHRFGVVLNHSSSVANIGARFGGTALSPATSVVSVYSDPSVASGCNLTGGLTHFAAIQGATFAGTVASQVGYSVSSNMTGATNNYGFRGLIASGTGRWNCYMDGTADNYFAGNVGIGSGNTSPSAPLHVVGETKLIGPITEGRVVGGNTGTAKTIALTNGTLQDYTLTGNCTFTMPTATAGQSFTLMLRTGLGNNTATFTGVKWPANSSPTITQTASRMDILTFVSDGTLWYGSVAQNYHV